MRNRLNDVRICHFIEAAQLFAVGKTDLRQLLTVERRIRMNDLRRKRQHQIHQAAFGMLHRITRDSVGVNHRYAAFGKHAAERRFARARLARQADNHGLCAVHRLLRPLFSETNNQTIHPSGKTCRGICQNNPSIVAKGTALTSPVYTQSSSKPAARSSRL